MARIFSKIVKIFDSPLKWHYLKNKNLFLNFLLNFWKLNQISNILKQRMIAIANVFPKLQTVKNLLGVVSVNTLTAHGKYFVQDCENFRLAIEMTLSEK